MPDNNSATQQLGTEKVSKLLVQYALPAIISMLAAVLYNIADSIFIGHGVGPLAISALAVTMPMMNIAAAFGAMVGIGASSLISIKLGQNDSNSAKSILGNAVMLNIILGLSLGMLCLIFLDPILYIFGASDNTIGYARKYMRILLIGNVVTHIYMGLNNVLRATGYPRKSMLIMIIAVVSNCILDAVFIFWFDWGVAGAAWATVLAQTIAMIAELTHFTARKHEVSFARSIFKLKTKVIKGILSIGMAPFLMNLAACLIVIVINNSLKEHGGDMYIGAYGIVNRIAFIFLMIVFGLNQGMQPIVGYNFGAEKFYRVKQALKMVIGAASCVTTAGFILAMTLPRQMSMLFSSDQTLLDVSQHAIRIVMMVFPIVGFQIVTSNFFQSIGMAKKAIFLSLTRQLLFLLPLLVILPPFMGSDGVWMSMPIADGVAAIIAGVLLITQLRKFRKDEPREF